MIILDTDVLSEPLKPNCSPIVKAWLDAQAVESLYLTTTILAELLSGLALLQPSRRRDDLQRDLAAVIADFIPLRILPFDMDAARAYAVLIARTRAAGRTIAIADGQIAAIASVKNFIVATRDTAPFRAAGVAFINPWDTKP